MCSYYFPRKWMRKYFSCQYWSYICVRFLWRKDPSKPLHALAFLQYRDTLCAFNSAITHYCMWNWKRNSHSPESKNNFFACSSRDKTHHDHCKATTLPARTEISTAAHKSPSLLLSGMEQAVMEITRIPKTEINPAASWGGLHQWVTAML